MDSISHPVVLIPIHCRSTRLSAFLSALTYFRLPKIRGRSANAPFNPSISVIEGVKKVDEEIKMKPRMNATGLLLIVGICCTSLLLSCGSSQQGQSLVRAQRFELVDQSGKVRIVLGVDRSTGAAGVSFFDGSNTLPRILIGTSADGSTTDIALQDTNGNRRGELSLTPTAVRLSLVDASLKQGVILGASSDRTALLFNDDTGKHRAAFGITPAHEPALTIYDQNQQMIWTTPPNAKQ